MLSTMEEEKLREEVQTLKQKAASFDQIVRKYKSLEAGAEFYSKNWIELAEVIEAELRRLPRRS